MSIKGVIVRLEYFLKNLLIHVLKIVLFKPYTSYRSGKILVFRTGSIGDSICALPALNIIRNNFPNSEISILTNPGGKNVSMELFIDPSLNFRIINYQGINWSDLFKKLKAEKFVVFIELPQTLEPLRSQVRNMIFAWAIGAKIGLGWNIITTRTFKRYQEQNRRFISLRDHYRNVLIKEGLKDYSFNYILTISPQVKLRVNDLLKMRSLENKDRNIGVVVGAKRSANRWPIEYFLEVIKHYNKKGLNFLLVGATEDKTLVKPLLQLSNVHSFCGELAPIESASLLSHCHATLSNDTGPMHLSYAVGTPVIAIFGARDYPYQWYPPLNNRNKVFRSFEEKCSPCLLDDCPYNNACMRRIKPETVIKELDKIIGMG